MCGRPLVFRNAQPLVIRIEHPISAVCVNDQDTMLQHCPSMARLVCGKDLSTPSPKTLVTPLEERLGKWVKQRQAEGGILAHDRHAIRTERLAFRPTRQLRERHKFTPND